MRFVSVFSLVALLCAGTSAQAGFFLDRSEKGVARDDSEALKWLIRVTDRGCSIEAPLLGLGVGMLIETQMPAAYQTTETKYGPC